MNQFTAGVAVGSIGTGALALYLGSGWVMSSLDHLPKTREGLLADVRDFRAQLPIRTTIRKY